MNTQIISTEDDYRAALKIVSELIDLDPELGTPEADQLEIMGLLTVDYEAEHHPIDTPRP